MDLLIPASQWSNSEAQKGKETHPGSPRESLSTGTPGWRHLLLPVFLSFLLSLQRTKILSPSYGIFLAYRNRSSWARDVSLLEFLSTIQGIPSSIPRSPSPTKIKRLLFFCFFFLKCQRQITATVVSDIEMPAGRQTVMYVPLSEGSIVHFLLEFFQDGLYN